MSRDPATDRMLPGGLLGYLDDFEQVPGTDDVLFVRGWVLGRASRVHSLLLKRKTGQAISIPYGLPRPDVAEQYPLEPRGTSAGFAAQVTIDRSAGQQMFRRFWAERIDIYAALEDGQEIRCFSRRFPPKKIRRPESGTMTMATFLITAARRAVVAYRGGRFSFSPAKWFRSIRAHYRATMVGGMQNISGTAPVDLIQTLAGLHKIKLRTFLDSNMRLSWPQDDAPRVSILLVTSNEAPLMLQSLRSLQGSSVPVEIIIVDNASTDETDRLLDRLDGVKVLHQGERTSVSLAWRTAAQVATGDQILLLSNGAEVLPGSLESAIRTLETSHDVAAVGATLVFADGRLEEAGGVVWRDGSCRAYGHYDIPGLPVYMYVRDVDFCSGTFLLTLRDLFIRMTDFDNPLGPPHYEDIDYCIRLWKAGKRVVFDPGAVVIDFAGYASLRDTVSLKDDLRKAFISRHAEWISHKDEPKNASLLLARTPVHPRQRILVLDDRVPHFRHGAGFPRACELIRTLDASGYFVTFYPMTMPYEDWCEVYDDIPRAVEVILGWGKERLPDFLKDREGYYDTIIISRPHNMETFRSQFWRDGRWTINARVIYDAEAVFTMREAERRRMSGEQVTQSEVVSLLSEEMSLAQGVDAVFSVTDRERDYFLSSGVRTAWTLGHTVTVKPTARPFEQRGGVLFVGAMNGIPNRDAVIWFVQDIWPKVRALIDESVHFAVVGGDPPPEIRTAPDVDVLGQMTDLTPVYDQSRIFVAPSRLAAGIPIKVQTAAAHGLPVVCTPVLAEELGWRDGVELLVALDAEGFARSCARLYSDNELWQRLRRRALERVAAECSHKTFAATLAQALQSFPLAERGAVQARG